MITLNLSILLQKKFNISIAFRELSGIHLLMNKNFNTLVVRTLEGRRDERYPHILHSFQHL